MWTSSATHWTSRINGGRVRVMQKNSTTSHRWHSAANLRFQKIRTYLETACSDVRSRGWDHDKSTQNSHYNCTVCHWPRDRIQQLVNHMIMQHNIDAGLISHLNKKKWTIDYLCGIYFYVKYNSYVVQWRYVVSNCFLFFKTLILSHS